MVAGTDIQIILSDVDSPGKVSLSAAAAGFLRCEGSAPRVQVTVSIPRALVMNSVELRDVHLEATGWEVPTPTGGGEPGIRWDLAIRGTVGLEPLLQRLPAFPAAAAVQVFVSAVFTSDNGTVGVGKDPEVALAADFDFTVGTGEVGGGGGISARLYGSLRVTHPCSAPLTASVGAEVNVPQGDIGVISLLGTLVYRCDEIGRASCRERV